MLTIYILYAHLITQLLRFVGMLGSRKSAIAVLSNIFCGIFNRVVTLLFSFSVGVGDFAIGMSQISSFFSMTQSDITLDS